MRIRLFFATLTFSVLCTIIESKDHVRKREKRFVEKMYNDDDVTRIQCTGDCLLLYNKIISQMNNTVNPCENMYSYMCRGKEYSEIEQYTKQIFPIIQTYIMGILSSSVNEGEPKHLIIEKKLYQDCMKLDSNLEGEEYLAFEILYRQLIGYVNENKKWQDLDTKIRSLGFNHAFFDIKVIRDPEEPTRSIIVLQPPSAERIESVTNKINTIMYYKNYYKNNKNLEQVNAIQDLYDFIGKSLEEPIQTFFESLFLTRIVVPKKYDVKLMNVKMTIKDFNNLFTHLSEIKEFTKIDWTKIIIETFRNVNIDLSDSENIIIMNKPYFIELSRLLNITPNNVIVPAILTKLITENLVYIDWNLAKSLEIVSKPLFCLKETKLYGASHKLIYDSINADGSSIFLLRKTEEILANIVNALSAEIIQSYGLFTTEQGYLQYKLKSITDDIFECIFYLPVDLYANFVLTPSYFFNIIKYREMLKNQELKALRDADHYLSPFSLTDMEVPRNRFILYIFMNSGVLLSPTFPKAVIYGDYGTKVASFLYALMNENIFKDGIYDHKNIDWFAHPEYNENSVLCFASTEMIEYNRGQVIDMITEIFGLRIAYEAMLKDTSVKSYDRFSFSILLNNRITMEKLFFLTYVKNHCHIDDQMVNVILSNSESFINAFHCQKYKYIRTCPLKPFGMRKKIMFPLKI